MIRVHGKGTWAEPIAVLDEDEEQIVFRREVQASKDRAAIGKALLTGSPLELAIAIIKTLMEGDEDAKQKEIDAKILDYFEHSLKMHIGRDYFHPRPNPDVSQPYTLLPTQFLLYGVDLLSTNHLRALLPASGVQQIYWIDDSTCKLTFTSPQQAQNALSTLLLSQSADPSGWMELKPYKVYSFIRRLFIRHATSLEQDIPKATSNAYVRFEAARAALPRALLLKFNAMPRYNSVNHQLQMERLALSRSGQSRERTRDKNPRHQNNKRDKTTSPDAAKSSVRSKPQPTPAYNPLNSGDLGLNAQEMGNFSLAEKGMVEAVNSLPQNVKKSEKVQPMHIEAPVEEQQMLQEPIVEKHAKICEAAEPIRVETEVKPMIMEVEVERQDNSKKEEILGEAEMDVQPEVEEEVKVPVQIQKPPEQPPQQSQKTLPPNIKIISLDSDSDDNPTYIVPPRQQPQPIASKQVQTTQKQKSQQPQLQLISVPTTAPIEVVPGKLFKTFSENKVEEKKVNVNQIFDLENQNASPLNQELFTQIWNKSKTEVKPQQVVKQPIANQKEEKKQEIQAQCFNIQRKEKELNNKTNQVKTKTTESRENLRQVAKPQRKSHKGQMEIEESTKRREDTPKRNEKPAQREHTIPSVPNQLPTSSNIPTINNNYTKSNNNYAEQHNRQEERHEFKESRPRESQQFVQQKPSKIQECNQEKPKYNQRNDNQNERGDRQGGRNDRPNDRPYERPDRQQDRPQQQRQDRPQFRNSFQDRPQQASGQQKQALIFKKTEKDDDAKSDISSY